MAKPPPLDDRALRATGIPAFGIAIPHLTGLFGPYGPRTYTYWLGLGWFILLASSIWHANRWLLFRQREHVDWFAEPARKLLLLGCGVAFGTIPVTLFALWAWYRMAGFAAADWAAIKVVTLTNVICVVFVTHVYETVFLIRERENDLLRVARLERARMEAELEALRAQIDPHFLFNSLTALGSLIDEDPPRARAYNERLARVYRYILACHGRALVLLAEELDFLDDYLGLLTVRFGVAIRVTFEGRKEREDRRLVPPMALQVLLENAVKHNELGIEFPLEVRIRIDANEIVVSNERRPRPDVQASSRIGLRNLADRYRLAADRAIDVAEDDETFSVRLPLLSI